MTKPAIRVSNLSKQYRIGRSDARYRTFRDAISDAARTPFRRLGPRSAPQHETVWAIRDVNFEVEQGETLGIIGRNGAGKSTLLKIFSRITEPTSGRVSMRGRVASLLEVGTGFHPELTGRENVLLNGAILNMTRREIAAKFDAIVEFAEVGKFIDTPVKRYSSGMQLRLAFAVAAHLEPEILVIDEVLAVGDASFQRRCIDRMKELSRSGCTLLFVSHNMEMIPALCRNALWMSGGQVVDIGPAHAITEAYLAGMANDAQADLLEGRPRSGDGRARFRRLQLLDEADLPASSVKYGQDLRCLLEIEAGSECRGVSLAIVIKSLTGTRLLTSWTEEFGQAVDLRAGRQRLECRFQNVRIRPGRQVVMELWMHDGELMDNIEAARVLDVAEAAPSGLSLRADQGAFVCDYAWRPA